MRLRRQPGLNALKATGAKISGCATTRFGVTYGDTSLGCVGRPHSRLLSPVEDQRDIDVLVSFDTNAGWSLVDLATMQGDLTALLGRPVDLLEEAALRNRYRRAAILESKRLVYAA
jgi:hypothetical protein